MTEQYFTCRHCGGLRRQVMTEARGGTGEFGAMLVIETEMLEPTTKLCLHRSWDESGWNIIEVPAPPGRLIDISGL